MLLGRLDEDNVETNGTAGPPRESLKDRFKLLRMREEAGITPLSGDETTGAGIPALGLASTAEDAPAEDKSAVSLPASSRNTLAPGTASGVNAGPSAMPEPEVDWDLWQSVVYEGPAAVARTDADELNRAIATGIPSAIRGVIWQVLTQSRNEELETLFKILAVRGTDKEKRQSDATSISSTSNTNSGTQNGDGEASSASSVHSEFPGPYGSTSPKIEKSPEAIAKAQAAATAERKKREKEDAASLQKLEKTIRRDLGARTSFSKYAAAAGLQDGLFSVCKAYALYDEGVGYAQGMNFIIMPLLFNVGSVTEARL